MAGLPDDFYPPGTVLPGPGSPDWATSPAVDPSAPVPVIPGPASANWPGGPLVDPSQVPQLPPPDEPSPPPDGVPPSPSADTEDAGPVWLPPEIARQWRGEPAAPTSDAAPGQAPSFGVELERPPGVALPVLPFAGTPEEKPSPPFPAPVDDLDGGQQPPAGLFPFEAPETLRQAQEGVYSPEAQRAAAEQQGRRLLLGGPEAQAKAAVDLAFDRNEFVQRQRQLALEADARDSAADVAELQTAMERSRTDRADLRRRYQEISNERPSAQRYVDRLGPGGAFASVLVGIAGAASSVYNGGKNSGADWVMDQIDKDIDRQAKDIERRERGVKVELDMVGQEDELARDLFKTKEATRLATYERAERMIANQAARFDPAGTRALMYAQELQKVRERKAAALAAAEEKLHKRAIEDAEINIKMRAERRQSAAQAQAVRHQADALRSAEERWAFEHGAVRDANGNWIALPGTSGVGDPQKALQIARGARVLQENEQFERGRQVLGQGGKVLGKSLYGEKGAQLAADVSTALGNFRSGMARLLDLLEKGTTKYRGLGSDRWQAEDRTRIEALRDDLANQLAKLRDPGTANREGEVAIAKQQIPDLNGWLQEKNPIARYETLVRTADDRYEEYMRDHLEPGTVDETVLKSRHYKALDDIIRSRDVEKPTSETAAELALPVTPLAAKTPAVRYAVMSKRARQIASLGDREDVKSGELAAIRASLQAERTAGTLADDEYQVSIAALSNAVDAAYNRSLRQLRTRAGSRGENPYIAEFRALQSIATTLPPPTDDPPELAPPREAVATPAAPPIAAPAPPPASPLGPVGGGVDAEDMEDAQDAE